MAVSYSQHTSANICNVSNVCRTFASLLHLSSPAPVLSPSPYLDLLSKKQKTEKKEIPQRDIFQKCPKMSQKITPQSVTDLQTCLLCVLPKRRMKGSYLRVLPTFLTLPSFSVTFFTLGSSSHFLIQLQLNTHNLSVHQQLFVTFFLFALNVPKERRARGRGS
jgi:hypothetical protein